MPDLLIRNCDVLRVESGRVWIDTGQDIAVDGNRIIHIGPHAAEPAEALQVVEARGLLAIPGLMNTHAHVPMVLFRGMVEDVTVLAWFNDYIWPLESNLTDEDIYWGALLGMAEMISCGVTSVADHYFAMDEVARAVEQSGMRANLAWAVFGHEGEAKLDRTCQFVQDWNGKAGGRITAWLGPHAPYTTTPDFLRLSAKKARELGVGIHIHVSETPEQVRMSLDEHGMTPVRLLDETGVLDGPALLAHCRFPTADDLTIMGQRGCGVAHAPKTYMKLGDPPMSLRAHIEAGVPVGLASDGAASSNTLDILEQLKMMVLAQKATEVDPTWFTVAQALEIAFEGSARVLHQQDHLGALRTGMLADIALLRQDGAHVFPRYNPAANLIYSTRPGDVDTVVCDGKVLLQGGKLLTIDLNEVKRQISTRLERLSERVPGRRIAVYPS